MASPQKENGYTSIANELLEAIMRCPLPQYEWRVLLCIIRFTYGWNKKDACISYSTISKATGIKPPHVVRAVKGLVSKNIIRISKEDRVIRYAIQKDYDKWILPVEVLPVEVFPVEAKNITCRGNKILPVEVIGTPLKPNTDKGLRGAKDIYKDIYIYISLRERLLEELKIYFPNANIPKNIPTKRIDYFLYLIEQNRINPSVIEDPVKYIQSRKLVIEPFPSFIERQAERERLEKEKHEKLKRERLEFEKFRRENKEEMQKLISEFMTRLEHKNAVGI